MANIVGEASVSIDRSSDVVWDWLVDPANMHLWVKDVDDPGRWIDDGEATVGSRYRILYKYGRKPNEIVFEVKTADRGKWFEVDTVSGPYPILVNYGFVGSENGDSTELTINMNARSDSKFTAVLFVATGWFAKWFMNRRLQSELQAVKREVEAI